MKVAIGARYAMETNYRFETFEEMGMLDPFDVSESKDFAKNHLKTFDVDKYVYPMSVI